MNMSKTHALIFGIIIAIIIIVGYSYVFLHSYFAGFYEFYGLVSHYPIQVGILVLIGIVIGYLLGKAY